MHEAFKREVKEETNLEISNIRFVCIQDCVHHKEFYQKKHFLLINFTAFTKSKAVELNEEAYEYRWLKLKESLALPLNEPTRFLIEKVLSMKS
jgi:ADP-ribose pyrophosphatase YjhB (NUDIX family)